MVKKSSKSDSKKSNDDEMTPTRAKIREIFEGKLITTIMSIVTIFALFGDDFRLWFTSKGADIYIDIFLIISLFAFSLEILVNSCVVDDFKFSFFFWLDIIATISIVPDILILLTPMEEAAGMAPTEYEADAFVG